MVGSTWPKQLGKGQNCEGSTGDSDYSTDSTVSCKENLFGEKVLFHHALHTNNEPTHITAVATAQLVELVFIVFSSFGLGNFVLFQNLKKSRAEQKFYSNEEVIRQVNEVEESLCFVLVE